MNKGNLVFLLLSMAFCFGCVSHEKKALLIIPDRDVQETELSETRKSLEGIGFKVVIASPEGKEVNGMSGGSYIPDLAVGKAVESDYTFVACIGGMGVFDTLENQEIIALVQEFYNNGKYTTAICGSTAILANAGLLEGIEATTFPNEVFVSTLKKNGAVYIDKEVVVSGKIITANGPGASAAFGETLARIMKD